MRLRSDAEHGDGSDHGLFLPEQDSRIETLLIAAGL